MLQSIRVARVIPIVGACMFVAFPAAAQTPSAAPAGAVAAATGPDEQSQQASGAAAALRAEVDRLRQEFESVRDTYGARLAALEAKLAGMTQGPGGNPTAAAVSGAPVPPATAATTPPAESAAASQLLSAPAGAIQVPAGAAGAGGPQGPLPIYGNPSAMSKIFNPDMAVIGNFIGASGQNTIDRRPALHLDEAEMSFQAIVDPYARADFFLSASPDGLTIEEGFITFPTLPGGLLMKVGKMKAQFGKVNTMHSHVLPWADEPLVMRNLLGGDEGLDDSGISVSKLILNPILFLEATGEVYQGSNGLFKSYKRSDLGYVGRLRGYRDLTEGTNLDFGTSVAYGHNEAGPDSTTRLFGVDATIRYRPLRRAIYKKFIGRTELMWSRRNQPTTSANAFGTYVSGEYQFAQRWFAGARYDYAERANTPSLNDTSGSLLLTYWPSEFSQIRGQFRRTNYAEGVVANEILFQFLFSIGAHGAHTF